MTDQNAASIPESLAFLGDSNNVTRLELARFLKHEIERQQLIAKIQAALVTRTEAANIVLARLQTWLENQGFSYDALSCLSSTEVLLEMESFLNELENG